MKIDPEINPEITADFRDREIQNAFEELLKGYSQALVWTKDPDQGSRLSEVIVFSPGKMERAAEIPGSGSLEVEKDPETGAFHIRNRILVTLKKPISQTRLAQILDRFHAQIQTVHFGMGISALTLKDPEDSRALVAALKQEGLIHRAEPDYAYQVPPMARISGFPETGMEAGNPESSFAVAILDTGIREEYAGHSFVKGTFNALAPESPAWDSAGVDLSLV